jgi:hypothetical protein
MATHVPAFDNYVSARFELAGAFLSLTSYFESEELADMAMELAAGGDDPDADLKLFKESRESLPHCHLTRLSPPASFVHWNER